MSNYFSSFPNRTLCATLQDMRDILDILMSAASAQGDDGKYALRSYHILYSLVEEAQVYGSRMEAGLDDKHDMHSGHEKKKILKREIAELEKRKEELGGSDGDV